MAMTERETQGLEAPPAGEWEIDAAHSNVTFTARYMMLTKVRGRFGDHAGTIHIGEGPEDSWAQVTIKSASIDTNNSMRDDHLKSPDFLDVESFPELTFRSTGVERTGPTTFRLTGQLTIKDVARPVVMNAEFEGYTPKDLWGKSRIAFNASAEIDREEFGITWNQALETGGVLVGKTVGIDLEVQAVRPTAEAVA